MVYVVNKHNKPLMPTNRHGHVRRLMKEGKAVPICNNPFTIKLKYETPDIVQELWLGIDPGRENIGVGVSKEDGECVFLSELKTHNKSIKKQMSDRKRYRQARKHNQRLRKQRKALRDETAFKTGNKDTLRSRKECYSREVSYPKMEKSISCKVIRGAESQFANRKRPDGWLTPSARQLLQMHFRAVESAMKIMPISHISIERNVFDFQKLENADIKNWQYSKGPLYGYKDYKDYIYAVQDGKCLLCGNNGIDDYHHIKPRSQGGSDTVANIAGLCDTCHNGTGGVHKDADAMERISELKSGLSQKYRVSLLNSVMPELLIQMQDFCEKKDISFSIADGKATHDTREEYGLPKKHCVDGYAISISDRKTDNHGLPDTVYIQQRFKKKSAANISKLNAREYYAEVDGKMVLVAKNRHKAESQTSDSLEEDMAGYAGTHSPEECDRHLKSLKVKPAKRTCLSHRDGKWCPIHVGDTVLYEKHNKVKGNTKRMVFVATGIKISDGYICSGTKNRKLKYCRKISSGCTPFVDKTVLYD